MLRKAIWKDVKGLEGLFQVSSNGCVKSLSRDMVTNRGGAYIKPEKIISQNTSNSGYLYVSISVKGRNKGKFIHRLIAQSFIPNPENKPCVNHKNGIKTDNRVENLEWVTYSENSHHAVNMGLKKPSEKQRSTVVKRNSKIVIDTVIGVFYDNCLEAAETLGMNYSTLRAMLNGNNTNRTNLKYA